MGKKVEVKEVVTYGGHNVSPNGKVSFTLKAKYSEMVNSVALLQVLNNDVSIKAKVSGSKAMMLGTFRVKQILFDHDGESILKFDSIKDSVETDNLNSLPLTDDEVPEFRILAEAVLEDESDGEDSSEGEEIKVE